MDSDKNSISIKSGHLLIVVVILMIFLGAAAFFAGSFWNESRNKPTDQSSDQSQDTTTEKTGLDVDRTEGTFYYNNDLEICKEDGKPVVYLLSATSCTHCVWIGETFNRVMKEYMNQGKIMAYHWDLDTGDNALTEEVEESMPNEVGQIYQKFNPNQTVPTFVFGCKYWRVGNAYESANDLTKEETEFRSLIDKLLTSD